MVDANPDPRRTEFLCNIKTGSLGDTKDGGYKVSLELPDSETEAYMRLHALRGMVIRVVMTPDERY